VPFTSVFSEKYRTEDKKSFVEDLAATFHGNHQRIGLSDLFAVIICHLYADYVTSSKPKFSSVYGFRYAPGYMLVMTAGTFCEWHFMANLCRVIKLRESNYTGSAHAQTKRQKPVGHADCRYKMSILLRVFMACNIQLFVRTITQ